MPHERMGQVGKEATKTKNLLERPHGNLLFNKITKNANIITVLTRNTLYEFILPQKKQIPCIHEKMPACKMLS